MTVIAVTKARVHVVKSGGRLRLVISGADLDHCIGRDVAVVIRRPDGVYRYVVKLPRRRGRRYVAYLQKALHDPLILEAYRRGLALEADVQCIDAARRTAAETNR